LDNQQLNILVVKAHPHDFTHCAGTLGVHSSLGDNVTLVVATSGATTHNEKLASELLKPKEEQDPTIINEPLDEYASQKADELYQAAALFGISDVRILNGAQPFKAEENPDVIRQMMDIVDEVRPQVLITQSPYLQGSGPHGLISGYRGDDHDETAYAIENAITLLNTPRPGASHRPHQIAATFYPGVYFDRGDWDLIVDVADWYEQRVQAEVMFESQGHTEPFARKRIEISAGSVGWFAGTGYAEAFVRSRPEVVQKLTLSPYSLLGAQEPSTERQKRMLGESKLPI